MHSIKYFVPITLFCIFILCSGCGPESRTESGTLLITVDKTWPGTTALPVLKKEMNNTSPGQSYEFKALFTGDGKLTPRINVKKGYITFFAKEGYVKIFPENKVETLLTNDTKPIKYEEVGSPFHIYSSGYALQLPYNEDIEKELVEKSPLSLPIEEIKGKEAVIIRCKLSKDFKGSVYFVIGKSM